MKRFGLNDNDEHVIALTEEEAMVLKKLGGTFSVQDMLRRGLSMDETTLVRQFFAGLNLL